MHEIVTDFDSFNDNENVETSDSVRCSENIVEIDSLSDFDTVKLFDSFVGDERVVASVIHFVFLK